MLHQVQIRMPTENVGQEQRLMEECLRTVKLRQVQEDKADIMNMRQEAHTCVVKKMQVKAV